jgi:hypothetical protein
MQCDRTWWDPESLFHHDYDEGMLARLIGSDIENYPGTADCVIIKRIHYSGKSDYSWINS